MYAGFFSFFVNLFQLTFSIYMLLIYDKVLTSYSMPTLVVITLIALVAVATMFLLDIVRSRILVRMSIAMDHQMSEPVLQGMIRKSAFAGEGESEATLKDVSLLRNFLSGSSIFAFFDLPWTPIFIGMIFILHPLLGLVAIAGGILTTIAGILQDKATQKPLLLANNIATVSQDLISMGMRNAEAVRSMGMLDALTARWHKLNDVVIQLQSSASDKAGVIQSFTKALGTLMQIAVYAAGAWLAVSGKCTPGVMIAASIIMGRALAPINLGMAAYKQIADTLQAYRRLDQHFKTAADRETMELPPPTGALSCEGVTLVHGGKQPVLFGISFKLNPGESMGLIGPSAAGKTTLCRLLIGLWPPTSGSVRLDGADVFAWDQEKLGKHLGYLPQDIELFSGTVADNIGRFGEYSAEAVVAAAQKAGAHEMILRLPDGYDTKIGMGGARLSGGQRQRIGLARALYGNPRFVILDEPTSNLDEEGVHAFVNTLAQLKEEQVTVVVVSHQMNALANVDKLLLLAGGKVVQFGDRTPILQALTQAAAPQPVPQQAPKPAFPRPVGGVLKAQGN